MKITVLGFSEAGITLIFDILESQEGKWELDIINNLQINNQELFHHPKIQYQIFSSLPQNGSQNYLMGAINVRSKINIFNFFNIPAEKYLTICHSSALLSSSLKMGNGCILNAGSIIAGKTTLGNFVYINRKVSIGHHTVIGDFSSINPGSNIAGYVHIGDNCLIGMGANILDHISVGDNTIIGAGSLVTRDIPPNCIAYGNPCKVIRENFPDYAFPTKVE